MATVHRFYVPAPLSSGEVALPPHVAHQVTKVLRLCAGDPLVLFDGTGGEWQAELVSPLARPATARLLRHRATDTEPATCVTLCQAMLKADRFEWVLQKATELGVARFVPLLTQRVIPTPRAPGVGHTPDGASSRLDRWRRIVVEAVEQSGRTAVPEIETPCRWIDAVASAEPGVLCWEREPRHPFGAAFARAAQVARERHAPVRLYIGPEGGLTADEVSAAAAAGVYVASLGPRILRSETAALAAVTLALYAVS